MAQIIGTALIVLGIGIVVAVVVLGALAVDALIIRAAWNRFPVPWFAHHHLGFWEASLLSLLLWIVVFGRGVVDTATKTGINAQ